MSNQNHLSRGTKPYQYYYFRCIIPKDLRETLGKSQIRLSLKHSDYCYSKIVANSLYIIAQNIFEDFRNGNMKDITLEDVKNILRIEVRKSLLHIHHYQYGTNVFSKVKLKESISRIEENEKKLRDRLENDYKGTIDLIENEIDKILITQNLEPNKKNVEYKGLVRRWIELKLIRQDWKRDLLNESGKTDEDFKIELETKWKLGLWKTCEEEKLTPVIENYAPEPIEPYIVKPKSIEVKYNKGQTAPSPLFSEIIPNHLELMRRNKRREETIGETEQTYEDVKELIGDKPIGEYTNLDGRNYRTAIISLPKNRKKMKQYRDFNLL